MNWPSAPSGARFSASPVSWPSATPMFLPAWLAAAPPWAVTWPPPTFAVAVAVAPPAVAVAVAVAVALPLPVFLRRVAAPSIRVASCGFCRRREVNRGLF